MRQSWRDLLFAHWRVPASALRPLIPPRLTIQQFDGSAWIGLVPFRMTGVMLRPLPDLPGISAFPELNLRTYVEHKGKAGRLLRTNVHHAPWPLQTAEAELSECDLHLPLGLTLDAKPETLHFARHIDVVVWKPEAVVT